MTIRRLPQDVAAKIAAGEVVERPAAVVKELVENAIDAWAKHIRVDLMGGGLDLIRVTDDGAGLARDDLPLAFARHATSKIAALDDLERISTLGFRGEALASVAAVSSVTLVSRPAEAEIGAQITVNEGIASEVTSIGATKGTSVAVRGLFASVPARLKFLKTRATETGRCMQLVEQYALAYPEIRFVVTSEGRQALLTAGDGKLRNVIAAVYGLSVAEQMTSLGASDENEATRRLWLRQQADVLQGDAPVHVFLRQPPLGAEPHAQLRRRGSVPLAAADWTPSRRGGQHQPRSGLD
jgi:DNA mismatch repair protein MutL